MAKEERAREEYKKEKMERLAWEDMMEKKRARYAETGIWE